MRRVSGIRSVALVACAAVVAGTGSAVPAAATPDAPGADPAPVVNYVETGRFSTGSQVSEAPYDVTVDAAGRVLAGLPGKVMVFAADGTLSGSFSTDSDGDNIDAAPDGTVYLSNSDGHEVEQCTLAGSCVTAWDNPDDPAAFRPTGVAATPTGQLWIANQALDAVHRRSPSAPDITGLSAPADVAYGAGSMYVADHGNARIRRFDATTGTLQGGWGQPGDGPNQFNHLVAVATTGSLVVSLDQYLSSYSELQFTDTAGNYLGTRTVPVTFASGLAADAAGNLYVSGKLEGGGTVGVLKLSPVSTARVTAKKVKASKSRKAATVKVACTGQVLPCTGSIAIRSVKGKKIGGGLYSLAPGSSAKVKLKLNRKGRQALRSQRRVKVTIKMSTPAGRQLRKGVLIRHR